MRPAFSQRALSNLEVWMHPRHRLEGQRAGIAHYSVLLYFSGSTPSQFPAWLKMCSSNMMWPVTFRSPAVLSKWEAWIRNRIYIKRSIPTCRCGFWSFPTSLRWSCHCQSTSFCRAVASYMRHTNGLQSHILILTDNNFGFYNTACKRSSIETFQWQMMRPLSFFGRWRNSPRSIPQEEIECTHPTTHHNSLPVLSPRQPSSNPRGSTQRSFAYRSMTPNKRKQAFILSLPFFVQASQAFVALVSPRQFPTTTREKRCKYANWMTRGWRRTELFCKMMLGSQALPVVVIPAFDVAQFARPVNWVDCFVVKGSSYIQMTRWWWVTLLTKRCLTSLSGWNLTVKFHYTVIFWQGGRALLGNPMLKDWWTNSWRPLA